MEIYLVGGAVRDKLLGYPTHEKDWVVVGATPEELLKKGYQAVGQDFPVFLHPQTKEEYALARTERKTAPGYAGFQFYAAKDVTLEQDLARRDLTINAIAEDAQGNIFDPFNGRGDIEKRILRHVSPAFLEDPVRVLRLARFAARYHHLGFTVADETMALMRHMVTSGEVDHLVAERVWKETSRALMEKSPEVFFTTLRQCNALQRVMPEIDNLFGVPQKPEHHPEIDTGIHTLMALRQTVLADRDLPVRLATLLHDLGKALTPAETLPSHHGHEERSVPLVKAFCKRLAVPKYERDLALAVAQFHTHCHRATDLKATTVVDTLQQLDAFRRPQRFTQFLQACEADSRGRTGFENRPYPAANFFASALAACQSIEVGNLIAQGFSGQQLGEQLRLSRISAIKHLQQQWQQRATTE